MVEEVKREQLDLVSNLLRVWSTPFEAHISMLGCEKYQNEEALPCRDLGESNIGAHGQLTSNDMKLMLKFEKPKRCCQVD